MYLNFIDLDLDKAESNVLCFQSFCFNISNIMAEGLKKSLLLFCFVENYTNEEFEDKFVKKQNHQVCETENTKYGKQII